MKAGKEDAVCFANAVGDDRSLLQLEVERGADFHRNSLLSGGFDALERGDEVYYVEDMGDTGPTASKVWVRK
jgi:hypothetical protein